MVGRRRACAALGRSRASHYRATPAAPVRAARPPPLPPGAGAARPRPWSRCSTRSASATRPRPRCGPPCLDEGIYLASISTMYRLLRERAQVRERRAQARRPALVKPELVATGPNQVWSWDITKLAGPYKWTWFQLYAILDVYSRYVVGWLVAPRESATLAEQLIADAIYRHDVADGQLTLHADRGTSMTSKDRQPAPGRPGRAPEPFPAPRVQRQPLLGVAVQDAQVLPGLPEALRQHRRRPVVLRRVLRALQQRAPPLGHRPAHPGRRPLRPAEAVREKRQVVLDAAYASMPGTLPAATHAPRIPEVFWINRPEEAPMAI